jgi:membrane-bound inhibitor of C-type lysozyme
LNRKIKAFNGVNFAQGAKFAEGKYIFFSADPRGIGFAFHRAGRAENKIRLRKNHSMAIQSIYTDE